jgi:hypothetical protein
MNFSREKLTTKGPSNHNRISCYLFEVKIRATSGDAGWRNGRVFSYNAFQAVNLLSAHGDISEIYFLKRLRGDWSSITVQTIKFGDDV